MPGAGARSSPQQLFTRGAIHWLGIDCVACLGSKEPAFVSGAEPPGQGHVRCAELQRSALGGRTVLSVSIDNPDSLETVEGETVLHVFESDVELLP